MNFKLFIVYFLQFFEELYSGKEKTPAKQLIKKEVQLPFQLLKS